MATHYQILGLKEDATHEQIASAYRRLAKKYHPDLKSGHAEQFRNVTDSYHVLSDPRRRREYDYSLRRINMMSDIFYTFCNSILTGVLLCYGVVFSIIALMTSKEYMFLFAVLTLISFTIALVCFQKARK
jgi:curved DNA-binding protein CbpA